MSERWRFRLQIAIALLAVIGVLLEGSLARADEVSAPLRVVTYNLLHAGPWSSFRSDETHLEERLEMVVRELQALHPDIVAFQEASDSRRHGNVAERIARRLGFDHIFVPATDRIFGIAPIDALIVGLLGFKEGPAILSRFPIVGWDVLDLPRCRHRFDPRILVRATLETPWGLLQFFTTHIARGDECQLHRIGAIVKAERRTGATVLVGDFNTADTSPALGQLISQEGFVDAFRSVNHGIDGDTVWQRIEIETPTVSRRVDYIFLVNGSTQTLTPRSSRLFLNRPGRLPNGAPLWASDHYGVFAEIDMTRGDRGLHAGR